MDSGYSARKARLEELADYLLTDEFSSKFLDAYIRDTAFVKKNVIKRELHSPSALLRIKREEESLLDDRLPLGGVAVMIPKNSIGLTLAKAIASSFLMGNQTLIYFPSQLKETAPVYAEALLKYTDAK
jgi:acyl-CoA reductase-like NAD-dependent aldehyde dehydrogenase